MMLAVGSRGDVQPLIALAVGLQRTGRHRITFVTSDDFAETIRQHGLPFHSLGINSRELLETDAAKSILETGRNVIGGMRQIMEMMQPLLLQMMANIERAADGAEAIIYSTMGLGAYSVAELHRIPCFLAVPFPIMMRTRSFPNFAFPDLLLGGGYNLLTHIMVEHVMQQLAGRFINRYRRDQLGLAPLPLTRWPYDQLQGKPVPALHGYSPVVVPPPADWGAHTHITGYWFLERPSHWQPPPELAAFLAAGPPPIYVGFGSMTQRAPEETTRIVLEALRRSGQRGLLATGWGGLAGEELPDTVYKIGAVPHDWLFPQVAAVVHHGGAGTTAAGLRAGVPSILVPHFADQHFWARQVAKLGVGPTGIPRRRLRAGELAAAMRTAVTDQPMRTRAAAVSKQIRAEDGLAQAVAIIEGYLTR
jgi:sterol 3beta-glucosyltransferase